MLCGRYVWDGSLFADDPADGFLRTAVGRIGVGVAS
jgi:hypothetical protein